MSMRKHCVVDLIRFQITVRNVLINLAASLMLISVQPTLAQAQQEMFASPGQASKALYDAVRNKDNQGVQAILGGLGSSGDEEQEKFERERFAQKYQEMHRLVREPDGSTMLYIGAENWPFPVPLVAENGKWRFDPDAGSQEIRAREIGENESVAITVCSAITQPMATKSLGTSQDEAPVLDFAKNLRSGGEHSGTNQTFHGYYFRVSQVSADAIVVAYPAEYGATGVMTFLVDGKGVYERDLGTQTASAAEKIQSRPTGKWTQVQ